MERRFTLVPAAPSPYGHVMQAIEERLGSLDATFLELELAGDGALMHTGGAHIEEFAASLGEPK